MTLYGYSLSFAALPPSSHHPRPVAKLFPLHDRPFTYHFTVTKLSTHESKWEISPGCTRLLLPQPTSSLLQPNLKHAMVIGPHQPPIRSFTSALTSASARSLDINVPSNRRQEDFMVCHALREPTPHGFRLLLTSAAYHDPQNTRDERGGRWYEEENDDDGDSFFPVRSFPFALSCWQRPKVYISDFYPDEQESFVDTDEAEVSVDVHSVRGGEEFAEVLEVQRLGAGKLGIFRLSSLRVLPALCRRLSQKLRTLAHSQY